MFDDTLPYASRRAPVMADNLVATSQPLAAQAGLEMLYRGGNAVDAALAAAITLTVVEPTSNGLGSDAFALLWDGSQLLGINGSGRAPAAWTLERFAGDSVMVFFNDPVPMERPAEAAVRMALAMQAAFPALDAEWHKRGYDLGLGCGIAQEYTRLGQIGFEGRWDYAAIGSVTNLAARLCSEARGCAPLTARYRGAASDNAAD